MPKVYDAFVTGHFSAQMSKGNMFGQDEADKTIENTINRDCNTAGGKNHKEADTHLVLSVQHARGKCIIPSDNIDVLVLLLGHAHKLGKCFLHKGK